MRFLRFGYSGRAAAFVAAFCALLVFPSISASQSEAFPNELPEYKFFAHGKLKTVEFGKTRRTDIETLFGNDCEKGCDLEDRFMIKVDYLSCDDCMTTNTVRDRAMCPLSEFMETIELITLTPKGTILFSEVSAAPFTIRTGGSKFFKDGSGGVSYETFEDTQGLRYSIKRSDTSNLTLRTPGPTTMNGPLYSIEYKINTDLESKIFLAPFATCRKPK